MACHICGTFMGMCIVLESGEEICESCILTKTKIIKDSLELSNATLSIQQLPQRQDSTTDQLKDLCIVANRLGMYDASDYIRSIIEKKKDDDYDGVGTFLR